MVYMKREWEPQPGKMPCLSIAQPFCSAILLGKKTIELRTWGTRYKGLIALHAGTKWYGGIKLPGKVTERELRPIVRFVKQYGLPARIDEYPTGAIVGVARLVRCSTFTPEGYERLKDQHCSDAKWTPGEFGWLFEDVQALAEPIPVRGYLGLFAVDEIDIQQMMKG